MMAKDFCAILEEVFIAAFKCRLPPEEDEPKNDYDSYQEAKN